MCGFNWLFLQIYIELMVYQNIFCNYFIFIKKTHKMSINKNLLEEINRFRMISSYQPGKLMTEQKIINEKTQFFGKTYVYYNSTPNSIDGVTIGYVLDETNSFYPNNNGAKLFDLQKNSPYKIDGSDSYFNDKWKFYTGNHTFMFDYELDDMVNNLQDKNKEIIQVLSDVEGADWKNGQSGSLIFISSKTPAASNIKGPGVLDKNNTKSWNLLYSNTKKHYSVYDTPEKGTPPSTSSVTIEQRFIINGARKTFCDNVVNVDLTGDNLIEFNEIILKIKTYINSPNDNQGKTALSKFGMNIMGQADSAAPGWVPGPPCNLKSKEIGHDYGGMAIKPKDQRTESELHQMNMYLATMRAKNYKTLIVNEIKKQTGLDIKIYELPAKEYYGQGESKRGSEWRSMVLTVTAPEHTFSDIIPIDGQIGTDPKMVDYEKIKNAGYEKTKTVLKTNDQTNPFKKFNTIMKGETETYVEAIPENLNYLSKYTSNEYSISNASVSVNGDKFEFTITTNDGNIYKFEPKMGLKSGEASDDIASKALLSQFNCKAQGVKSGVDADGKFIEFASFVTTIGGRPHNDSLDMYDESSEVTINNITYYKIVSLGFQLVGTNCQAYKTIQWPTEDEIKLLPKYSKNGKDYSDKELEKIKKSIQKSNQNKIRRGQKKLGLDGELEQIQNDING